MLIYYKDANVAFSNKNSIELQFLIYLINNALAIPTYTYFLYPNKGIFDGHIASIIRTVQSNSKHTLCLH